jgi:4-hydroxy-tetrahydrodipicolinate synthase
MAEIRDVITATLTPFGDDGTVDRAYLYRHLRFQEENGINGVAPCGTNGEGQSLSLDERKEVIRFVVENKGSMFVLAGTGCANLPETIELTRFAERVGADAVLVVPPYFYKPSPEGIRSYYRRLFDAVAIPIMLYNIPSLSRVEITDELLGNLSDYPHLVGVKDTSGDLERTKSYIQGFPKLKIFSGSDTLIEKSLDIGVSGIISGSSNVFPSLITRIYRDYREGKPVAELQERLIEIREMLDQFPAFATNKTMLSLLGFPRTHVRSPLVDLTEEQAKALAADAARLGLLSP